MPRILGSPTPSENEIDILGDIYAEETLTVHESRRGQVKGEGLGIDDILDEARADDGDGEDEAYIALQQAASFRKSSTLKGRTVKRGGGFQAMGRLAASWEFSVPFC
jgi:ATP-dependent RNA helicase DDX54/DBP10